MFDKGLPTLTVSFSHISETNNFLFPIHRRDFLEKCLRYEKQPLCRRQDKVLGRTTRKSLVDTNAVPTISKMPKNSQKVGVKDKQKL